jgi:hypothetical protein
MGLEAFGIDASSEQLRRQVLDAQQAWGDDAGSHIWALAAVVEARDLRAIDLYQGGKFKRWALTEVEAHVRAGHPVVLQVSYRALPERQDSPYFGDHYIVITGLTERGFLYNDAIDSDGPGFDRWMTATQLQRAMYTNDRRYTYAGFAVAGAGV